MRTQQCDLRVRLCMRVHTCAWFFSEVGQAVVMLSLWRTSFRLISIQWGTCSFISILIIISSTGRAEQIMQGLVNLANHLPQRRHLVQVLGVWKCFWEEQWDQRRHILLRLKWRMKPLSVRINPPVFEFWPLKHHCSPGLIWLHHTPIISADWQPSTSVQ